MKTTLTIFCLFLFSTSILAEGFKLSTSQTKSFQLTTSLKNEYSLETLPKSLDTKPNRQELSHIIPSNILASVSYTTKNVSMESGNQFSLEMFQNNCGARQIGCSPVARFKQAASSRIAPRQMRRQEAYSAQNSNDQWFFGKRLIQNRNARMSARSCVNGSCF